MRDHMMGWSGLAKLLNPDERPSRRTPEPRRFSVEEQVERLAKDIGGTIAQNRRLKKEETKLVTTPPVEPGKTYLVEDNRHGPTLQFFRKRFVEGWSAGTDIERISAAKKAAARESVYFLDAENEGAFTVIREATPEELA